jgi:serine/threonine protein kinase
MNISMCSGYMPPEYLFQQVVSKKLDVFSLGVVITKIIAGPNGNTRRAEMPYKEFLNEVKSPISSHHKNDQWALFNKYYDVLYI